MVRLVVFIVGAAALGGCCMSPSGCYVAKEGPLSAWDGRGTGPDDVAQAEEPSMKPEQSMPARKSKMKMSKSNMEMTDEPMKPARGNATPRTEQEWAEKEAADRNNDEMLAKKLVICRDCTPSAREREAATAGSAMR
jgi:hypothetical protein